MIPNIQHRRWISSHCMKHMLIWKRFPPFVEFHTFDFTLSLMKWHKNAISSRHFHSEDTISLQLSYPSVKSSSLICAVISYSNSLPLFRSAFVYEAALNVCYLRIVLQYAIFTQNIHTRRRRCCASFRPFRLHSLLANFSTDLVNKCRSWTNK